MNDAANTIIDLDSLDNFNAAISGLCIVDFHASWCKPCKAVAPAYEELCRRFGDKLQFCKVDVDENKSAAQQAGIQAMPTFQVWFKGKKMGEIRGANVPQLRAMAQKASTLAVPSGDR